MITGNLNFWLMQNNKNWGNHFYFGSKPTSVNKCLKCKTITLSRYLLHFRTFLKENRAIFFSQFLLKLNLFTNLSFFCVVSNPHSYMLVTTTAPNIIRHFKPNNKNSSIHLTRTLTQRVHAMIPIQGAVNLRIKIRWIVKILPFPFSHLKIWNEMKCKV